MAGKGGGREPAAVGTVYSQQAESGKEGGLPRPTPAHGTSRQVSRVLNPSQIMPPMGACVRVLVNGFSFTATLSRADGCEACWSGAPLSCRQCSAHLLDRLV